MKHAATIPFSLLTQNAYATTLCVVMWQYPSRKSTACGNTCTHIIINSCARGHKYIFLNLRHAHSVRVRLFLSEEPSCFLRCISRAQVYVIFLAHQNHQNDIFQARAHRMSRWFSSSRRARESRRRRRRFPKRPDVEALARSLQPQRLSEWKSERAIHSFAYHNKCIAPPLPEKELNNKLFTRDLVIICESALSRARRKLLLFFGASLSCCSSHTEKSLCCARAPSQRHGQRERLARRVLCALFWLLLAIIFGLAAVNLRRTPVN